MTEVEIEYIDLQGKKQKVTLNSRQQVEFYQNKPYSHIISVYSAKSASNPGPEQQTTQTTQCPWCGKAIPIDKYSAHYDSCPERTQTAAPADTEQLKRWVDDTFTRMIQEEPKAQTEYEELASALRRLGYEAMAEAVEKIAAQEGEHWKILQELKNSARLLSYKFK